MESNRNLSSIISKIRDEGPPSSGDAAPPDTPVIADDALQTTEAKAGRRVSRKLWLGLILPLALTAGLVLFAGNYAGYRDNDRFAGVTSTVRGWFTDTRDAGDNRGMSDDSTFANAAVDEELVRELRARQLDIMARLDQLTDTVTVLNEANGRNRADSELVLTSLRQEQQAGIDMLKARITELQQQIDGMVGKPAVQTKQAVPAQSTAQVKKAKSDKPVVKANETMPARRVAQKENAVPAQPTAPDEAEQAVPGEEWVVNLAASSNEQAMSELAARLKKKGISVERQVFTIDGDLMYRLRAPGFKTSGEARRYADRLDKEFGLRGGWVSLK